MKTCVVFAQNYENVGSVVCFATDNNKLIGDAANSLDSSNGNFISNAIKNLNFKNKFGECISLLSPTTSLKNVIVIGVGNKILQQNDVEDLGGIAYSKICHTYGNVAILGDSLCADNCDDIQARLAFGVYLKSWKFDKYKKSDCEDQELQINIVSNTPDKSAKKWGELGNLADSVNFARLLASEPGNVMYPETLANIAMRELLPAGVKVEVFDKKQIEELGMGAFSAVASGSIHDPRLLVMRWEGADQKEKPLAFVGKGLTFDSGGINLKPENGMEEMKYDMAGSATVIGLMKAVALNKVKKNIVAVAALAENMPSGSAQRPGDIVKSMSGLTIEVLNTDAEGRLTLADALWYTQNRFKPESIIDLATLTGAIVVSLGHEYAGLFSNDEGLLTAIKSSSEITGEKVWHMPINDYFESTVESDVADLKNLAGGKVRGGSITAACFLKRFVNNCKWAHIDIAGVEATYRELHTTNPGTTGFGVRLLYNFITSHVSGDAKRDTTAAQNEANNNAQETSQAENSTPDKKNSDEASQQKQNTESNSKAKKG